MAKTIIYTRDLDLRDKHQPGLHRAVFFGEIERTDKVITDMPAVRDAYEKAGIEVVWIGKSKKKAVKHVGLRDHK